ncbi:MAG: hypothetical protein LIO77_05470 [Rikenellaceae bacterium]|nr:hypothetical protein [Rikenellaceae bacterium]
MENKITMEKLLGMMDEKYYLTYINYDDNFNSYIDLLNECLEKGNCDLLNENYHEWFYDCEWQSATDIINELKEGLKEEYSEEEIEKFFDEHEDEIRDTIFSRDCSTPYKDLFSNTSDIFLRVELSSRYDGLASHEQEIEEGYSWQGSYLRDITRVLNLNPFKVKRHLQRANIKINGLFPDKRERNGNEYVSYPDLINEFVNNECNESYLTFACKVSALELYNSNFDISNIILKKGCRCGLFFEAYGQGSLIIMELLKDLEIDLTQTQKPCFELTLDTGSYGLAYNYCDEIFESHATIINKNINRQTT